MKVETLSLVLAILPVVVVIGIFVLLAASLFCYEICRLLGGKRRTR